MRKIDEAFATRSDDKRARDLLTAYGWVLDTMATGAHFLRLQGLAGAANDLELRAQEFDAEVAQKIGAP